MLITILFIDKIQRQQMTAPNQHTLATALLSAFSLGMLNFTSGKLIIKDPITGTCNIFKQAKDELMNNFN